MWTRREFLETSLTTLILVPLAACASDDGSPTSAGDSTTSCQGVSSTGSNSAGHIHTVCVPNGDLTSPPASGATYTTSADSGHTHTITLSEAQLQTIAGDGSVNVTSSGPGHTHNFAIAKA